WNRLLLVRAHDKRPASGDTTLPNQQLGSVDSASPPESKSFDGSLPQAHGWEQLLADLAILSQAVSALIFTDRPPRVFHCRSRYRSNHNNSLHEPDGAGLARSKSRYIRRCPGKRVDRTDHRPPRKPPPRKPPPRKPPPRNPLPRKPPPRKPPPRKPPPRKPPLLKPP